MTELQSLAPGAVFAQHYRVVKALGAGGMGSVYVVEHVVSGARLALKLMRPDIGAKKEWRTRFLREARVSALIESEHVVQVPAAGIDETTGTPWLVMELLEGEDLGDYVERAGPRPAGEVIEILRQLCHGLGAAHDKGVVHRDLKPGNVFRARARRADVTFTIKVLDFGIAKVGEEGNTPTAPTKMAIGTPYWMAPEQIRLTPPVSPATDVWALGLLAFHLLTGRLFWISAYTEEGTLATWLEEACHDPPIPKASARAAAWQCADRLPPWFDAWFARCVARDPRDRFATATLAFRGLEQALSGPAPAEAAAAAPLDVEGPATEVAPDLEAAVAATVAAPVTAPTTEPTTPPTTEPMRGPPPAPAEPAKPTVPVEAGAREKPPAPPRGPTQKAPSGWRPGAGLRGALTLGLGATLVTVAVYAWRGSAVPDPSPPGPLSDPPATTPAPEPPRCRPGMVLVPGGTTVHGSVDDPDAFPDETPHEVTLTAYCIDRTEVTVAEYSLCVTSRSEQGPCLPAPATISWADEAGERHQTRCNAGRPENRDHPVNCVDWSMAAAFCAFAGKRLPTEAEWEFAARGTDWRKYVWGNDPPTPARLNACGAECRGRTDDRRPPVYAGGDEWPATAPAGAVPGDESPFGARDMAGNVGEWTSDWYAPYPSVTPTNPEQTVQPNGDARRVRRGGSWLDRSARAVRAAARKKLHPSVRAADIGFRCAARPPP